MTYTASGDYTYVDGCVTNILHLTITVTVTPAVSIVPSANNVFAGTSVTFTATPVNGGTASYAWFVNALPAGTNNFELTYVPANNDAVYVVMTSSLTCVTAQTATSNTINMIVNPVIPANASWTGLANDGDWFNTGNWDEGVPGAITNVTIPGGLGSNYPENAGVCNNITIENGASVQVNPVVLGSASVKSFITAEAYHYISSPVAAATAGSVYPGTTFMRVYDETNATAQWVNITENEILVPFKGYSTFIPLASGNQLVTYTGTLNSGSFSNNLLTNTTNSTQQYDGYNLVGNPYPSRLNLENGISRSNVDAGVYFWNPALNGGLGDYAVYTIGGTGTNGASQYVAVGQGFFVKVNEAFATGAFGVSESSRSNETQDFFKSSPVNQIRIRIEGGVYSDETVVLFNQATSGNFDNEFDAYKLKASAVNHVYTKSADGYELSINALPSIEEFNDIPLYLEVAENNTYVLTASMFESIGTGSQLWIEDLKTGVTQNLNQNSSLEFNASVGDNTERFRLKISSLDVPELSISPIKVWFDGENIRVENSGLQDGWINIRNVAGQDITRIQLKKESSGSYKVDCAPGIYLVSVITSRGHVTSKLVVR